MADWSWMSSESQAIACCVFHAPQTKSLFLSLRSAKTEAKTLVPGCAFAVITAVYVPFDDADAPDRVTIYSRRIKLAEWTREQGQLFGQKSAAPAPACTDAPGLESRNDLFRLLEISRLPMAPFRHECAATLQWGGRSWQRCVFMQPCVPLMMPHGLRFVFDRDTELLLEWGYVGSKEGCALVRFWSQGAVFWMEAPDNGDTHQLVRLKNASMKRVNTTK